MPLPMMIVQTVALLAPFMAALAACQARPVAREADVLPLVRVFRAS